MIPTTILEWFHNGEWREIGWRASTPKSVADLREHGAWLAQGGGWYRLVQPNVYRDAPPVVVHTYAVAADGTLSA